MATTAAAAWEALTERARDIAEDSARDSFFLGFGEGWSAQENRPFHCAYCGYECRGDTDAATIELARAHAGTCEDHPLAVEIHRLRATLAAPPDAVQAAAKRLIVIGEMYEKMCFDKKYANDLLLVARAALSGHQAGGGETERLRLALERYADRDNWFRTTHIQSDGWPQPVWAWDTMEEPWQPATAALTAPAEGAEG